MMLAKLKNKRRLGMSFPYFEGPAYEFVDRILALIPDHPEILEMENPRDLFEIEGFECADLELEYNQAAWAFGQAKYEYAEANLAGTEL